MGVFTDHPHTAITEKVNQIIETDVEPEIELPELLSLIKLNYSGAIEAARATRKKLKYGSLKQQLKSIDLLNVIVFNGGKYVTEIYNDRKLLERLRESATDVQIDIKLRKKIISSAILWNEQFEGKKGYEGIANLKKQLPNYKRKKTQSRNDFINDEAYNSDDEDVGSSSTQINQSNNSRDSSLNKIDLNKKYKIPKINLTKESPKIKLILAEATKASIDLTNALKTLKRDKGELSTSNEKCVQYFEKARIIRRKILRYLQLVDSEEFLGSLIHSNEELVKALQLYSEYSTRPGYDSDEEYFSNSESLNSDEENDDDDLQSVTDSLASSMIEEHQRKFLSDTRAPPRIPVKKVQTNDDDPFGDSNQVDESADWK
ncbi:hypothetical protein WICMUC_003064 [Wickerhamomyces mucosus]|uniref:VHS domain-containing protein n=1 Tax=Wickerhamomyces mucosus TaxID=1378264 RepID=A0A9P8PMP7_9ASCO|nr:hypothetical protein WICMUC_003064 [Wickerhamomyces mucosus]